MAPPLSQRRRGYTIARDIMKGPGARRGGGIWFHDNYKHWQPTAFTLKSRVPPKRGGGRDEGAPFHYQSYRARKDSPAILSSGRKYIETAEFYFWYYAISHIPRKHTIFRKGPERLKTSAILHPLYAKNGYIVRILTPCIQIVNGNGQ